MKESSRLRFKIHLVNKITQYFKYFQPIILYNILDIVRYTVFYVFTETIIKRMITTS